MAIWFHNEGVKIHITNKRIIKDWIKSIIVSYKCIPGTINFIFVKKTNILEINKTFLGHDYPTDIISFDYSELEIISGDIYISPEVINENSFIYNTLLNDEFKRVIIHGILHLLGLKDKNSSQIKEMRNAENLALVHVKDLIII